MCTDQRPNHCSPADIARYIQSTPLIKDALILVPLSFIEEVSFIEGFW